MISLIAGTVEADLPGICEDETLIGFGEGKEDGEKDGLGWRGRSGWVRSGDRRCQAARSSRGR